MPVRLTVAELASLEVDHSPPKKRKPYKSPRREEADLLRQALAWLKLKGLFAWRANAGGGLRRGRGGRTVPVSGNPAGTPDVLCVLPPSGRLCGIEIKSRTGTSRPSQEAWARRATAAGALCLTIRSLDELIVALAGEQS